MKAAPPISRIELERTFKVLEAFEALARPCFPKDVWPTKDEDYFCTPVYPIPRIVLKSPILGSLFFEFTGFEGGEDRFTLYLDDGYIGSNKTLRDLVTLAVQEKRYNLREQRRAIQDTLDRLDIWSHVP